MQFFGALTALVTPFKNGAVDEAAYREFIEFQISEGIHGLAAPPANRPRSLTKSMNVSSRSVSTRSRAGCPSWPVPVPTIPSKPSA